MRLVMNLGRAIAVAMFALCPLVLSAQILPPLAVPRPPDPACQDALAAAAQLTPNVKPDSLKAVLIEASPCHPEFGRAIGFAMRASATTGTEGHAAVAFLLAPQLKDSAVFAAARSIAASTSSSEMARVLSLLTLFHYLDRQGPPSYQSFTSQVRSAASCAAGFASDRTRSVDYTPLPLNAASESRAVAVAIQRQSDASPALQSASYCVLEAWRKTMALPSNAHWPFTVVRLTVDYVCGNRFRLRNAHRLPIALQWKVASLPLRVVEIAPAGERLLDVGMVGDLTLYLDGDLILTRSNGGTSCH